MFLWIIQIIIISFIFIFLVHHLIQFFTNTLTVPKIKDLVNNPSKKYDNIYEILSKDNREKTVALINNINTSDIDLLPIIKSTDEKHSNMQNEMKNEMKNELKSFLKSQLNTNVNVNVNDVNDVNENISYYQFK